MNVKGQRSGQPDGTNGHRGDLSQDQGHSSLALVWVWFLEQQYFLQLFNILVSYVYMVLVSDRFQHVHGHAIFFFFFKYHTKYEVSAPVPILMYLSMDVAMLLTPESTRVRTSSSVRTRVLHTYSSTGPVPPSSPWTLEWWSGGYHARQDNGMHDGSVMW